MIVDTSQGTDQLYNDTPQARFGPSSHWLANARRSRQQVVSQGLCTSYMLMDKKDGSLCYKTVCEWYYVGVWRVRSPAILHGGGNLGRNAPDTIEPSETIQVPVLSISDLKDRGRVPEDVAVLLVE